MLYCMLCGDTHGPEVLIFCLFEGVHAACVVLELVLHLFWLMDLQLFDATASKFQQHLFVHHLFLLVYVVFDGVFFIIGKTDGLGVVALLEEGFASEWERGYLLT